jgi:hypothetical protein
MDLAIVMYAEKDYRTSVLHRAGHIQGGAKVTFSKEFEREDSFCKQSQNKLTFIDSSCSNSLGKVTLTPPCSSTSTSQSPDGTTYQSQIDH